LSHRIDPCGPELYEPDLYLGNRIEIESQIMTVREAAIFLKFSSKKIYKLVSYGQIPYKKIGREIRFYLPQLREWLEGG
jgi:excisionase family DNA binding protein